MTLPIITTYTASDTTNTAYIMSFDPVSFCKGNFEDDSIEAGLCIAFSLATATSSGGGGGDGDANRFVTAITADEIATGLNVFFLLFAASFIFMMQTGFAMLCAGSIRQKNVKNIMLVNYLDPCIGAIGFWSVGFAFAFGGASPDIKSFIGYEGFFLANVMSGTELISWFFQFAMASTAATIVAGTVAERCKMEAYLCYSLFLTGFVYPVIVHSIWSTSGFLSAFNDNPPFGCGMHDFAGSGVIHLTGGVTALIAAKILGPRIGRFYDRDGLEIEDPEPFPPHSVALQVLGTFILWVGWYGFNPGSVLTISSVNSGDVAALAAVNTTIAAASGCLSALFIDMFLYRRETGETAYDITMVMNGTLCGLVAITAGCATVAPWGAMVIGIVAGWVYYMWSKLLIKLKIDDAVDAIPVHLGGGSWGCIAVGLLSEPTRTAKAYGDHGHYGWFYMWGMGSGDGSLLAAQICGILWVVAWVCAIMTPFFYILKMLDLFRVDSLEEEVGCDLSHHKGFAYDSSGVPDESTLEKFDLQRSAHQLEISQRRGKVVENSKVSNGDAAAAPASTPAAQEEEEEEDVA